MNVLRWVSGGGGGHELSADQSHLWAELATKAKGLTESGSVG